MATRADMRSRIRNYLDDSAAAVWPDAFVDAVIDEGHRRLAPIVLEETSATVTVGTDFTAVLPAGTVEVMRVHSIGYEVEAWREHAGTLRVVDGPGTAFDATVEYLGSYTPPTAVATAVSPLPEHLTDLPVYYAVSRCYRELARDRTKLSRYSVMVNGQVDLEDIAVMSNAFEQDFMTGREENRTRRAQLVEDNRRSGGDVA